MNPKTNSSLQGFLGLSLLTLVLISSLAFGANRPIWWSLLAIGVFLIFIFQVWVGVRQPATKQVRSLLAPAVLFLGVVSWGWIQTMTGLPPDIAHPYWALVPDAASTISADPGQGRQAVMRLLCYGMIFATAFYTCVDRTGAVKVLMIIAIFSTGLAAFGIFAALSGSNPVLGNLADPGIVKATFVNRNSYATYASFGVLANLAAATHLSDQKSSSLRDRIEGFFGGAWVFAVGLIICMAAVALTGSRAGAMAAVVGLIVFLIVRYSNGRWRGSLVLFFVAALLGFVLLTSSTGLMRSYLLTSTEDARFLIFPAVVDAISDRPLLGHGLGSFQDVFRAYIPEKAASADFLKAHNTYLELVFSLGIPATLAWFTALGWIVVHILRGSLLRKTDRMFSCFALGCIATAAFHSIFDFSLEIPAVAALFSVILGLGYAQSNSEWKQNTPKRAKKRKAAQPPIEEPQSAE